jgi:hypothetical protein
MDLDIEKPMAEIPSSKIEVLQPDKIVNKSDSTLNQLSKTSSNNPAIPKDDSIDQTDSTSTNGSQSAPQEEIPLYKIDLSKAPEDRYTHVVEDFLAELTDLPQVFDDLISNVPYIPNGLIRCISKLLLRRVHDSEQMREIRGISKAAKVDIYLLVALNVLLDLLMGCTSGGAVIQVDDGKERMVHFRSLNWTMDKLRDVIVELHFVEHEDGPVIGTSVTYVGFVGVLTGVRYVFHQPKLCRWIFC